MTLIIAQPPRIPSLLVLAAPCRHLTTPLTPLPPLRDTPRYGDERVSQPPPPAALLTTDRNTLAGKYRHTGHRPRSMPNANF